MQVELPLKKMLTRRPNEDYGLLVLQRFRTFATLMLLLSVAFLRPLLDLVGLATQNSLYSHILLIPFVSVYLVWLKRKDLPTRVETSWLFGSALAGAGLLVLAAYWLFTSRGRYLTQNDHLCMTTSSFVLIGMGIAFACFGRFAMRTFAFPAFIFFFIVPFPTAVEHGIEAFFQHASAETASLMFGLSQTPVLRDGLFFKLPGIIIEVAQECSGIRSTLVLFITSLVGGYIFFEFKSYRAILAFAIIPIAVLRNAFRIFAISMLCVHVDPEMIHSIIHRRGGPLFFALSLVPLFVLLVFLYRREQKLKRTLPTLRAGDKTG